MLVGEWIGTTSKTVSVDSKSSVKISLKPNEGVVASVSTSRGLMKVRIRSEAYLTGTTTEHITAGLMQVYQPVISQSCRRH